MFKKALLMVSVFFITLKVESSDQQQGLRNRTNHQVVDHYAFIMNGQFVSEENIVIGNVVSRNNSSNGITVIGQSQDMGQGQPLHEKTQYSEYLCVLGLCLGTYCVTGSGQLAVVTPVIIAVTTACIYPQSIE